MITKYLTIPDSIGLKCCIYKGTLNRECIHGANDVCLKSYPFTKKLMAEFKDMSFCDPGTFVTRRPHCQYNTRTTERSAKANPFT